MASALLASRNEPCWGERKVYMKKNPNSNPNPRIGPHNNRNPSPNPNPNLVLHHEGYEADHGDQKMDDPAPSGPVVSQDSSSFNWNSARRDAEVPGASTSFVSFKISALSKKEVRELKRRLVSELEQVRSIASRIESRELQSSARSVGYSASGTYCNSREVTSPAALQQKQVSLCEKEIRVSEAKLPQLPVVSCNREVFGQFVASSPAAALHCKNLLSGMMKKCAQILGKMMRHKGSRWFNSPVDVLGMGLHDYPLIIKRPMDLGTVKSKLGNGFYKTPLEFADDIRLTFNNALLYNPETHEVYKYAAQFLRQFEGHFGPAYAKYEKQIVAIAIQEEKMICSSWSPPLPGNVMGTDIKQSIQNPPPVPVPVPVPTPVPQHRSNPKPAELPSLPPPPHQQKQAPQQQQQQLPVNARTVGMKLPKPKARDANKRAMSFEERQKLIVGLQSLPEEKMTQVLQIIKRRNVDTEEDGDAVVLDFETMDIDTLWELDRFLYNCKKTLSKMKRQEAVTGSVVPAPITSAAVAASFPPDETAAAAFHPDEGHKSPVADDEAMVAAKRLKKGDPVDEDVDIGEEMTLTNYPSVEIEKDDGYASSSSSSSSGSSSSSDSDSVSSSGSDSDEDDDGRSAGGGCGSGPSRQN